MENARPPVNPRPLFPDWNRDDADDFNNVADTIFSPLYRWLIVDIEASLGRPVRGLRVLDIGGGPGHMAVELLKAGAESVVEVDVSKPMLELAVERVSSLGNALSAKFTALPGDAASIPLPAGSVDLVFSRGSIQFWPHLPAAFDEMKRVLADGGAAYVGGGYGLRIPAEVREEILRRRAKRDAEVGAPRIPPMDRDAMERLARERGGTVEMFGNPPGFWLFWKPSR